MFDKVFNTFMTILFISFMGLLIYLGIEMQLAQKANNSETMEFVTFEYEVSRVDTEGFFAESLQDDTGIYITSDKLQPNQKINEGDMIRVFFDKDDWVEGIEHVEVVANE